jgi:hypothetical protein
MSGHSDMMRDDDGREEWRVEKREPVLCLLMTWRGLAWRAKGTPSGAREPAAGHVLWSAYPPSAVA